MSIQEKCKNIVVIPTYNEKDNIESLIQELVTLYPFLSILVVDDNSPDGTGKIVETLAQTFPQLRLLKRDKKTGLGSAYKAAFLTLRNEPEICSVITMDADGSHDPKSISQFLDLIKTKDLIIGSRYVEGGAIVSWELWRRLLSWWGNHYARFWTGLKICDVTSGFTCFNKKILDSIHLENIDASSYAYQIEFKYMCSHLPGIKIQEIPITFRARKNGESKLSLATITEALKTVGRLMRFH